MIVIPALHPAALLRGRGDDANNLAKFEQTTIADIAKAIRLTHSRPIWDERAIFETDSVGRLVCLFPTVEEVERFCAGAEGSPLALDTETTGESTLDCRLLCCGFASANGKVLCVPFLRRGGARYWSPYDEVRVRAVVGKLLASKTTPKIIHNKSFDQIVLWANGLPVEGDVFCCYVDSETEFLTERGWRKYDDVKKGDRLATVAKDGTLEYQNFFRRVSKQYDGDVYTFETPHSRAVVTGNHRMLCRPFYRQRKNPVGKWEFRRADQFVGQKPDQFDVRVAFENDNAGRKSGVWQAYQQDRVFIDEDFATLLGLWITDGTLAWQNGRVTSAILTQSDRGQAIDEMRRLAQVFLFTETSHTRTVSRKQRGGPSRAARATEIFFHPPKRSKALLARLFLAWCGRYSRERRLPPFTLRLPVNLRRALLRGLLLGDSSIVYHRRVYRTSCERLAGDVQALALSLGFAASIHWAGDCFGVTLWDRKLDRAGARFTTGKRAARQNITKRRHKGSTRVVCFSVPNETLVTRSRGKPAFHGNTMQAHHVIDAELPHGLGYCGTRHLDIRYWKDDVKGDEGWLNMDEHVLRLYNCLHGSTTVILEDGRKKPISWLVRVRYAGRVKTADSSGRICFHRVVGWYQSTKPAQKWIRIWRAGATSPATVTPDHRVACWDGSVYWKEAKDVRTGDALVLPELDFTPAQRQALLGTILGDSSLRLSPTRRGQVVTTAGLECVHVDRALVAYKHAFLSADTLTSTKRFGRITLRASVQLGELRAKTWWRGKRCLPIEWLDDMGPRGLAWWFADDGCRQNGFTRKGQIADSVHLALCRYSKRDQLAVRNWFRRKFGACSIQQGSLYLGRPASRAFAQYVGAYVPPSCRYKLPRDFAAPAWRDSEPQHRTQALVRPATRVEEYTPSRKTSIQRARADTRWCIDVENTHAFFTPTGLVHNCRDCLVALRLMPIFSAELSRLSLWPLFHEEQALASLMARATIRGLSVDFVRRDGGQEVDPKTGQLVDVKGLGPTLREQMNSALGLLKYVAGDTGFDPMKPTAVRGLLFDRLRLPVVKMANSGVHPSTDKEAMVLLALAADNDWQRAAIKGLADFRSAQKYLSTFVEGLPVLGDQALHVSWKLLTVTGRFSSSPNAQTWGAKIKKIFRARQGFKFVGADLSQAELRAIAYFANDRRMLEMYRRGLNIHTVNLAMSLRVRPPMGHKDLDSATEQYIREQMPLLVGADFSQLVEMHGNALKGARTLIKNDTFGRNYGAIEDTVFSVLRSKRDPDNNELLFPGLLRSEVEANGVMWRKLNVDIMTWWSTIQNQTKARGYYQCPVSGRIRWFRAGFKQNELLNTPIQTVIASIVNKRMLEIQDVYDKETGGQALIVQQVHDAVNAEAPHGYEQRAAQVMNEILSQPVDLPGHPGAMFPPDPALVGTHLSDV